MNLIEKSAMLSYPCRPLLMQIASQVGQVIDAELLAVISSREEEVPLQVPGWELSSDWSHGCHFQLRVESELISKLNDFRAHCPRGLPFLSLCPDASRVGGLGIQNCLWCCLPTLAFLLRHRPSESERESDLGRGLNTWATHPPHLGYPA